jgi:hypothetical protein
MDPTLIVTGFSAVLQATQTWLQYRDSKRAAEAFRSRITNAPKETRILQQAATLAQLVPQPILDTLGGRARKCWERYLDVLKGDFLPGEVDEATQNVKKCLCRELKRIHDLNGSIPAGDLSEWWNAYCAMQ